MYTKGANAIYHVLAGHNLEDFFPTGANGTNNAPPQTIAPDEPQQSPEQSANQQAQQNDDRGGAQQTPEVTPQVTPDVTDAAGSESKYKAQVYTTGVMNPIFESDEDVAIMRKNTYSDTILQVMMHEEA